MTAFAALAIAERNAKLAALAVKHAAASNYSFEAYMNEYSIESCRRADRDLAEVKAEAAEMGVERDDLIVNVGGVWLPREF